MTPKEKELNRIINDERVGLQDTRLAQAELKGIQQTKAKLREDIENLPNPYPLDIFDKIELNEAQTKKLNNFLISEFCFTLDKFSAELMRRARENCKLDILKSLEDEKQ